jgi:hypothetical protein
MKKTRSRKSRDTVPLKLVEIAGHFVMFFFRSLSYSHSTQNKFLVGVNQNLICVVCSS